MVLQPSQADIEPTVDSGTIPAKPGTTPMTTPVRNPKDSMASTWRKGDKSKWGPAHYMYDLLRLHPQDLDVDIPVHSKNEKIPVLPEWHVHRWILYHAAIPLILHQLYFWYTGRNLGPIAAGIFYTSSFNRIGQHQLVVLKRLGQKYGYLDGDKHERDGIPDHSVGKIFVALFSTVLFRVVMAVTLAYRRDQTPADMSWISLPVEIGLYGIALDFWFYWYHRVMHHFEDLWRYHRTHHLTKHPNPMLTLYADSEQEIFDIVVIPLLAYTTLKLMGLPMSFYEWWICHQYVVFSELTGHSGLRLHIVAPSTMTWLLKYFNAELCTEDHDLHHRKGWKKSHNYGKQTRLWDRIFGTCHDRIESAADNIDYENPGEWPWY